MSELMSVDATGFANALRDLANTVSTRANEVIRKACIDLYTKIVMRTPVDTGRARASWQISTSGVGSNVWEGGASASEIASNINQNVSDFRVEINADTVTIYNNLEYISFLENGHSQQAPTGMVAVSLAEFEQHFRRHLAASGLT
jgi:hypothetical protein